MNGDEIAITIGKIEARSAVDASDNESTTSMERRAGLSEVVRVTIKRIDIILPFYFTENEGFPTFSW